MKKIISAGIVPFYLNNSTREYLIVQHATQSTHWDFPKGKVEIGEDNYQTALRELKEEVSILASILPGFEYSFSYRFKDYADDKLSCKTVYFYIGKAETKNVVLSHEHQDYAWLDYEHARKQLTYENAKKLLDKVHIFLEEK